MKYRFNRNKVEEKIQKQIQDHVLKADDVKPGDMPQRIGIAATYSGNKLSTTLTADLADSDLDGVELKQAARLLAREYEMPLEQLARPLTSKKKKGPQLFEDPISGQPMTTRYAMNMLDKYETRFFTDTLRSYNKVAKGRGQKPILPGAAASAFDIIARNTSTDNLDFRKTLGASAAIASAFGKDKVKWANFNNSMSAIKQFAPDMPDTDKIIMAQATAMSGGVLKTGYDVATMRAMSMENLTENQRRSVLNKLQEAQAIIERKGVDPTAVKGGVYGVQPQLQAIMKPDGGLNWPAINALGEEERANVLFLLGRSQLEGTYDSNINAVLEDAENDQDKFSTQMADHLTPSWLESGVGAGLKALDELTKAVNTAGELVRAGAAWARIDTIGGTGTAKASPEVIDAMVHEHLERAGEIWHGDYTLADSLQEDGVPPIAAMATETIFQMALDPTILAGQAVTATRAARSLEALRGAKGAESVVGAVDNLIYGSIKGTSASAYGRTVQGLAKGFQKATGRQGGLARFLVKAADETGDDIEYYTRLANSFKKVGGGKGIHPKAATHIHDYVKAARVAEIPEDEIVTTVGDLLKGFLGQNLRGSKAEVLLNNIQDSKTTLGQQAERFGPDQPFYYGPHSDKVDEALTSAMRDMTGEATQGIFGVAPGTVRMTDIPFRPAIRARERINNVLGDSAIGKTWRSLGSHLPPTAATPEHDLDTFVHEMMARSGRYNRAEIAEKEAEALRIMRVGPGTGERETKFLKFMTDMQDDFILKESSRLGIRPEDADQLVSQARKKAIELHAAAYGIEPKELAEVLRKGTKAKVFRTPQFSTQLFNNFYAMDPKHIEDIFQQAIGYKQEAGQAFRRAFGKPMKEVALHENTFKAFNENWTKATLESINRAWKFSVVVSGRYVVRVVLMDEQLRYMNDLGVMSRAIGAGSRARKAEDLGLIAGNQVKRVFNPDEASWVTRAVSNAGFKDTDEVKSAITQFRETGVLSPQLEELTNDVPAARKVIDDVMDGREASVIDEKLPIAGRIRDEEAVRPGSAADIFSSAEREEGVFQRFMKRKTKMGASAFDVVEPDNRGYMLSLEHVLKNQVAREPAGLIALRGIRDGKSPEQIRASLVKFFHSPEGKAVADRMGVPASGVNGRAEQIEYMVRGYIDADPQIANAVLEESQDLRRYLDRIPMANRQTVQGYAVSEVMGDETKGAAIMHTISRYMFENPTNALSRQPFFKQHYTNMRSFLYQNAADEGLQFTDDLKRSMDGAAKEFAINRTMDVMFDFRKQGRWSEMIRFVAPFAQPWAEAWTVWPRLMAKNPAFAARGVTLTKQFIDEGIIKKDKKTGEYVVPLTNHMMAAPILGMLFNGEGKNELPGWTLSAPLSSMNFMFSSMFKVPTGDLAGDMPISIPGLNPVANWALQRMANNTDIPMPDNVRVQLAATAFEYGSLQTGKEFVSGFLPGWVQAGAQKLGIFEDEAYLNKTATGLRRLYEARGLTPAVYAKANGVSLAEAEVALQEKSLHQAKDLILTKSFFGTFFGFPTSPQIKMPTEELDIELREMREKYGLFEGNDRFNEKYGHKYFALTVGSTESDGYIPANDWVKELLITDPEAKEFAQRHPRFFMALVPSEHRDDPFSAQAYGRQFDMGLLSARDPEEFGQALDKGRGWAAFNELSTWKNRQLEQYKGLPESSNPVEAINDAYTDRFNALQQEYPEWAKDYADQGPGDQFAIQEAQQVLKVPMFAKSDAGQGLKDYLLLRTRVRKQMAAHNLESLGTDTSADAGVDAMLENGVKAIISQHPEYQIIHESLFSNDLQDANIQTEAAKIRAKQSPEEQQVQLKYETKLDQAQEKISRAFDMDDSKMIAKAYGERRQLYNQYYAKYGDTPENPVNVWWATRSEYTKKTTIENVATTPYIYLSQFDRRVILNEKTSDKAEKTWAKVLDAAGDWERQDRIAKAAAAHDPVFAEQLKHANDWGWAYKKMNDYTHENSNRGEAWSTFFDTLGKVQKEVEQKNLHGINSYDPAEVAQYEQMRNHVETLVEHLGNHSEQFRTDWKRLPIEMFFPDNWYVLGRFD